MANTITWERLSRASTITRCTGTAKVINTVPAILSLMQMAQLKAPRRKTSLPTSLMARFQPPVPTPLTVRSCIIWNKMPCYGMALRLAPNMAPAILTAKSPTYWQAQYLPPAPMPLMVHNFKALQAPLRPIWAAARQWVMTAYLPVLNIILVVRITPMLAQLLPLWTMTPCCGMQPLIQILAHSVLHTEHSKPPARLPTLQMVTY